MTAKLLDGQTAVVTGGSRGLGRKIAETLAIEGCRVAVTYKNSSKEAQEVIRGLPGGAERHLALKADVSSEIEVNDMAKRVSEAFNNKLNILVNNAGTTAFIPHSDLEKLTTDIFDQIYQTNLRGAFYCIKAFQPQLAITQKGLIVNISSIAAHTAVGSNIAYCAMKAALNNMTSSLARVLAPDIRVVAVSPGLIDTKLTDGFGSYREEQKEKNPMNRVGTTLDVANCVLSIATTLQYLNGTDIIVDGGRHLN